MRAVGRPKRDLLCPARSRRCCSSEMMVGVVVMYLVSPREDSARLESETGEKMSKCLNLSVDRVPIDWLG